MIRPLAISKKRLLIIFGIIFLGIVLICLRVGWVQIVKGDEYSKKAIKQQTKDISIAAKRGSICDRNGTKLAISANCYSIWARPLNVAEGKTEKERQDSLANAVAKLSGILDMDADEVQKCLTKKQRLVKIAKYQEKKTADQVRKAEIPGIEIAEDVKRYYPMGAFCSQVLGSVTDDNNGLSGIELQYNNYLKGTSGRWIKDTAADGKTLYYGNEKKYKAEDGAGLVLTIDEVIQHYVEKALASTSKKLKSENIWCVIMDPKTGDVLAMAAANEFNPNDSKTPLDTKAAKKVAKMSLKRQTSYWNKMWRNPTINDTYEPGSTFKLLTLGACLEEGVCTPSSRYHCSGSLTIEGSTIRCWSSDHPHGTQTVKEATGNSCNPVFMQLAMSLGADKFYDYLETFGVTDKTDIDYPGEADSLFLPKDSLRKADLATIGFGQSLNITPIQLLTAVSCYGNEGMLMKPRLVKALANENGDIIQRIKPIKVRQVVSKKTAKQVLSIMRNNVDNMGASNAKIKGYSIGGKTGTAEKTKNGKLSSDTYSSFLGMVPAEDPQFSILVVVDTPKGVQYGSETAAPCAKQIIKGILRYMNIRPDR